MRVRGIARLALMRARHRESMASRVTEMSATRLQYRHSGAPLQGLTADETAFFLDGQARFAETEVVANGSNNGLGPRFNSNQCFSCHSQPNMGGTSPAKNPCPRLPL